MVSTCSITDWIYRGRGVKSRPNKDCPLVVSEEIKLFNNVISTLVEDLIVTPNAGKKVTIDAPTSLVIPVGNINQRGTALQGSIRYNTTISQFEGYSGSNWSSLGGLETLTETLILFQKLHQQLMKIFYTSITIM